MTYNEDLLPASGFCQWMPHKFPRGLHERLGGLILHHFQQLFRNPMMRKDEASNPGAAVGWKSLEIPAIYAVDVVAMWKKT